jgi:hypothetical protein
LTGTLTQVATSAAWRGNVCLISVKDYLRQLAAGCFVKPAAPKVNTCGEKAAKGLFHDSAYGRENPVKAHI